MQRNATIVAATLMMIFSGTVAGAKNVGPPVEPNQAAALYQHATVPTWAPSGAEALDKAGNPITTQTTTRVGDYMVGVEYAWLDAHWVPYVYELSSGTNREPKVKAPGTGGAQFNGSDKVGETNPPPPPNNPDAPTRVAEEGETNESTIVEGDWEWTYKYKYRKSIWVITEIIAKNRRYYNTMPR